uniref:Uncharacterized protein n=1 Tax=Oryza nivara TaxID=4536 RepID=A0A0E0J726_ORYNI
MERLLTKEIPKTSKWRENISSAEISSKAKKVGKPYNAMTNTSSKLSKKNARPMCSEDLLRDGKDGGLRISDECSEHSTTDCVNQIKLVKRKLVGCSQGRIPNALGREEDDVGNVESTRGRKGQMGKKHKTNLDVRKDSRHLASNDSILEKKCRGSKANEDDQDSRLVKNGISGVSIPTILEAIKGHCSLPINEPIWRYNILFRLKIVCGPFL